MANWHDGFQVWLTEKQSLENAQMVANFLSGKGWTKTAISALCGNMRHESSINPQMYEYGFGWGANRGYGLVQWTPRSKYWDWAVSQGLKPENGDSQLARIDYETKNNIQWVANRHGVGYGLGAKYNFSFADFRQNKPKLNVNQATEAFMWNYEAPAYQAATNSLPERQAFAKKCYDTLNFDRASSESTDGYQPPVGTGEPNVNNNLLDFINAGLDKVNDQINDALTNDIYLYSQPLYNNHWLKVQKLNNNMYKVQPTINFTDVVKSATKEILNGLSDVLNSSQGGESAIAKNPNAPKPSNDTPQDVSDKIKKVVEKAKSYPDNSLVYSMYGTRHPDNGEADCSSFVRHCYRTVIPDFPDVTGPQYTYAKNNGFIVVDGGYNKIDEIADKAKTGDYVLMNQSGGNYSAGGAEHVGLMINNTTLRHQSIAIDGRGPDNANLRTYLKQLHYGRYTLCRPLK